MCTCISRGSQFRSLWLLLIFLFSVGASTFAGEPQWVEVRSPHFSVVTDAGEKRGREVALRFEQMRAVFGALMTKAKVTLPAPLQIVAFRNTKEMRQHAPLWRGKPTEMAGLFQGSDDRGFILLDMSVEDPWQVVFHEYGHQLLNGNTSARVQPWFDEGFAEYFSTIKVNGREAALGLPKQDSSEILRHSRLVGVADLFRVQQNSSVYNESGDHRSLFYAESWLVVHYLYDKQMLLKAGTYFDLVFQQRIPVEQAIEQAFGISAADLDKALRQYLGENRFVYYRIPAPAGIASATYTVAPMSLPDAKAVLADMHLHSADYQEKAIAEFEEVLKLQPDHPAALRGLGYAYLLRQDYQRASEYFRRAAERDSKDPRVLYYSALLLNREEGDALGNDRENLAVMQKRLESSIALDPSFADAYSLLAFTYMSQGEHEKALATMLKAVELNPRSEAYAFNLSQMYLVNQKYDAAIAVLDGLTKSGNPQVAARASQALVQVREVKLASAAGARIETRPGGEVVARTLIRREPAAATDSATGAELEPTTLPKNPVPPRFVKGKLLAVDCSAPPAAVLTIVAGTRTLKLHVGDSGRVIVIGADQFSCAWTNQKVAVNYHETVEGAGEVISVEVQ